LEWEVGGDGTFMVVGMTYPWRTSKWCSTDIYNSGTPRRHAPRICLPPFPEGGPTYIHGACICGAPRLSSLCVAPQIHAPRIWGPNTPGPGAQWGPLISGASLPWCTTDKMISVEHVYVVRHGYLSVEHRNVVLHR
jgi:hypothetical protein